MTEKPSWKSEAWSLVKRAPTAVKAALGGSVLAVAALVSGFGDGRAIYKDLFASPEKQLTELGYLKRDYPEFLLAITNRHVEAVELFAKMGKRVKPAELPGLFDDRVYHRGVIDALTGGGALTSEICPTSGADVALYTRYSSNPEKQALLKKLCGKDAVLNSLKGALQAEEARLAGAESSNSGRSQVLEACHARYLQEGEDRMTEAASRFVITSRTTYTERECILAQLNVALLLGGNDPQSSARAFRGHVAKCCSTYNAAKVVDPTVRDSIKAAIAMLQA